MARLIDADALQEEFKKSHDGKRLMLIDTAPTIVPAKGDVDAVPVVHGKWIVDSIASNIFRCCVCGQDAPVEPTGGAEYKSNYCPNCGAKMGK